MAFDADGFNTIHGGAVQLHIYKTVDAVATVAGSGYFNTLTNRLKNGDVIIVSDTNVPTIDMLTVTSATGAATVTTLNGT